MKQFLSFIFIILFATSCFAQPGIGGQPPSFYFKGLTANIDSRNVHKPDMAQIKYLDSMDVRMGHPYRIAVNIPVNLNMKNSGTWTELPDHSGKIWRLNITSPGAHALTIYYSSFFLPAGAKLFLYNANQKQVLGAYTDVVNPESGNFATEMVQGDNVTLEYFEPYEISQEAIIDISEVGYVYRGELIVNPYLDNFKGSGSCEVNINCSEGANWQNQQKGVCLLQIKIGSDEYLCSGSLVNNTAQDCTPYVLTADHCSYDNTSSSYATASDMNQWIFYFHYEASTCSGTTASGTITKTGCTLKAHDTYGSNGTGSDFYLVKLNQTVTSGTLYFNGWSRSTAASNSGVGIHHPGGDIMKISTYTTTLTTITVGMTGSHWQVVWAATANGHGVTEEGSSGSPLFNSAGLIVGTLTGGTSDCSALTSPDVYGKFLMHWASNGSTTNKQLKPWLDPGNTNVTTLNGSFTCTPGAVEEANTLSTIINLFPNPVSGVLHVSLGERTMINPAIKIYSILGKLVYSGTWSGNTQNELIIDVHMQPSGLYFLSLETGNSVVTKKFIIQH